MRYVSQGEKVSAIQWNGTVGQLKEIIAALSIADRAKRLSIELLDIPLGVGLRLLLGSGESQVISPGGWVVCNDQNQLSLEGNDSFTARHEPLIENKTEPEETLNSTKAAKSVQHIDDVVAESARWIKNKQNWYDDIRANTTDDLNVVFDHLSVLTQQIKITKLNMVGFTPAICVEVVYHDKKCGLLHAVNIEAAIWGLHKLVYMTVVWDKIQKYKEGWNVLYEKLALAGNDSEVLIKQIQEWSKDITVDIRVNPHRLLENSSVWKTMAYYESRGDLVNTQRLRQCADADSLIVVLVESKDYKTWVACGETLCAAIEKTHQLVITSEIFPNIGIYPKWIEQLVTAK